MMNGKSEVDAHFGAAPYQYDELKDARVHKVLDSYDVLGGPHMLQRHLDDDALP